MGGLQWEKEEKEEFIHPLNIFHKTMENKTIQTELDEARGIIQEKDATIQSQSDELKMVLNQCHLQVIFIHVLIKFYAVLEECMPVEENLRKILMMLEEHEQQSLQVKPLIYFI